jgi:hypothetical protein
MRGIVESTGGNADVLLPNSFCNDLSCLDYLALFIFRLLQALREKCALLPSLESRCIAAERRSSGAANCYKLQQTTALRWCCFFICLIFSQNLPPAPMRSSGVRSLQSQREILQPRWARHPAAEYC